MSKKDLNEWVWWKHGVIYHIYPRSFYDANNDGIGDINGIIAKLDYLYELGVDAIWLSPIYQSPNKDFGYDVSDYRAINPEYGKLEDFKKLLALAHFKGIKIIMDMIMNHTSDQHPWFIESGSSVDNPKRDWYIWHKGVKGKQPNNWKSTFGKSAWQFDAKTNQYYLHSFLKEQPDLNWRNKEMAACFFEEIKYWLDMGVDGFRLDVINMIVKDKKYRNNPFDLNIPFFQNHRYSRNRPKSLDIVKTLRKLVDEYDNRLLVGEVYVLPPGNSKLSASFLIGGNNGIHLAFDFSLMFQKWKANLYYQSIRKWMKSIPENGWLCNVLSNHDLKRSINRNPFRRHQVEKSKIEAVLLLSMKGTPFIYYGEEIGMKNAFISYGKLKDQLGKKYWPFYTGRDGARTPMQWNNDMYAGFSEVKPWLPVNSNYKKTNVSYQENEENSMLQLYRSLIQLRKQYPSLQKGDFKILKKGKKGVLAFTRTIKNEELTIILNFSSRPKLFKLNEYEGCKLLFSTHKKQELFILDQAITLLPFEAKICRINSIMIT